MSRKAKPHNFSVTDEDFAQIKGLADSMNVSTSWLIIKAVKFVIRNPGAFGNFLTSGVKDNHDYSD